MILERLITNSQETKQANLRATNIIVVSFAAFFLSLRYLARWQQGTRIETDDFVIFAAFILLLGALAAVIIMIHYGLGLHASTLSTGALEKITKGLFAFEGVYLVAGLLTKISVLLVYLRIFPLPRMRQASLMIGIFAIIWTIAIMLVCFLQCRPISKSWDTSVSGHCINIRVSYVVYAIPNTLIDIAILILPVTEVWKLKITFSQKIQVSVVFLLGSFVVFTSIYRFVTLLKISSGDLPWTIADACTWCMVESSVGIVSACLPTLAPLVRRINFQPWRTRSQTTTSSAKKSIHLTIGSNRNSHGICSDEIAMRRESVVTGMESTPRHDSKITMTSNCDFDRGIIEEEEGYEPFSNMEETGVSQHLVSGERS